MSKPTISIIAAMDEKRGIGKMNKIPWHIKADLERLKELTKGKIVIMGRKTYDSMAWYYNKSGKQMPGRTYLVVSRDTKYQPDIKGQVTKVSSLDEAFKKVSQNNEVEVFVIGGQQIFEQSLSKADRLYLTIVKGDFHADTFFPVYSEFTKVVSQKEYSNKEFIYSFMTLER